jgi:glyceraldehyde 3-phosphate dehydrogenase
MTTAIGINGFGRIGRNIFRQIYSQGNNTGLTVSAINDLTDAKMLAHLLKYDSVHGQFAGEVSVEGNDLRVNGQLIKIFAEKDPAKINWGSVKAPIVLECTGIFTARDKAGIHLAGGAKKVIISAPANDSDLTLVYGVNHTDYNPESHHVISNASCTTNCLAPVAKVLVDTFGIVRGTMTTIHSYTNDQRILDLPHSDMRRARAAALSMIPTTTGAAKAVGLVIPSLKGKVDGFAIRVPTPNVSVVDFVVELERDSSVEEINAALKSASTGSLKGVLSFCDEPLVSIDFNGNQSSSTVDSLSTMVIQKRMAKVISWYDNEMGFSSRMVDVSKMVAAKL